MSEAPHAPEGQVIEGRYRVVSRIADGGMATVYQAVDERLGRTVAIKIMHTQLAQGPHRDQFVERFHREARSAAAIANPHIVQVYDTGEFDGLDYLVMEYVHGVNLRYEMNQQGTFSVRETLRIIGETLDGLASAHRAGVVHRDIKPENILLNDRGHVQITDFGLAKTVSQATLSSTGILLGTAAYLAPEMIEENQATPQGDLYSVGIMAWEMLAGKVPFTSDNPVTLVFKHVHEDVPSIVTVCEGINANVAAFIAHLTARAVEARPADASAALAELQRLQSMLAVSDWQYRLPAANVNVSANTAQAEDAVAPMNEGDPTPPAPPTPPTQQFDDRTRKLNRVKPNMTTVSRCNSRTLIPRRQRASRCRRTEASIPQTAVRGRNPLPCRTAITAMRERANLRKSIVCRLSSQVWLRFFWRVAQAAWHGGITRGLAVIGPCLSQMVRRAAMP